MLFRSNQRFLIVYCYDKGLSSYQSLLLFSIMGEQETIMRVKEKGFLTISPMDKLPVMNTKVLGNMIIDVVNEMEELTCYFVK